MTGTTNTGTTALSIQPTTENELLLLSALHKSEAHVQGIKVHAFELQASNILNEAYANHLTADEFYELTKEKEKEAHEEARDKEMCKKTQQLYTAAIGLIDLLPPPHFLSHAFYSKGEESQVQVGIN